MNEQTKALRAVIEAARSMVEALRADPYRPPEIGELVETVEALEAHLTKVSAGFIVRRTWATTLAGHWVKAPNGEWYEVISNADAGNGKHSVALRINGKKAEFPRESKAEVMVRTRSRTIVEDEAVQLLSAAFDASVIESPPWEA
jgi:hypothetical protein